MNLSITNKGVYQKSENSKDFLNSEHSVYEVIRVIGGVALFLDDHYFRLFKSAEIQGISLLLEFSEFKKKIADLVRLNAKPDGNIKCVFEVASGNNNWIFTFIPHSYPTPENYKFGVSADLLFAERANPNAKVIQNTVREKANRMIEELKLYEVLLVDRDGYITEGSRSNVFFVKDEMFYTAPESKVLVGITRQKVIECLRQLNFELVEKSVSAAEISQFDAAFLTGTSPKVLPIRLIGKLGFNTQVSVLQKLMESYDDKIYTYIEKAKAEDQFC